VPALGAQCRSGTGANMRPNIYNWFYCFFSYTVSRRMMTCEWGNDLLFMFTFMLCIYLPNLWDSLFHSDNRNHEVSLQMSCYHSVFGWVIFCFSCIKCCYIYTHITYMSAHITKKESANIVDGIRFFPHTMTCVFLLANLNEFWCWDVGYVL
jgi:hypothetical protein